MHPADEFPVGAAANSSFLPVRRGTGWGGEPVGLLL